LPGKSYFLHEQETHASVKKNTTCSSALKVWFHAIPYINSTFPRRTPHPVAVTFAQSSNEMRSLAGKALEI
jgi:hypothetical protein